MKHTRTGYLLIVSLTLAIAFVIICQSAAQVQHSYGALDIPNIWTATNDFTLGFYTGPLTFAQITGIPFPEPGTTVLCSNCSLGSNPCTVGSSQSVAVYLNGTWVCNTGGGSSGGGTITGVTANNGITGGGSSGSVTVGLTPCPSSQVLASTGSGYACAAAGTGNVNTAPVAAQPIVQPCSGSPCQSTVFSTNNLANIRYVTPSFNFLQTDVSGSIGNLGTPGSNTLTLTPCPLGIDTASASHNYVYPVRIAGTGTAEQATVTGGTCTPGLTSGTITLVTVNAHAAGFTIGSASTGIQEAWNDAWTTDVPVNAASISAPYVKLMAGTNYNIYSTVYLRGRGGQFDGGGAYTICATRDRCIYIGTPTSGIGYHKLYNLTGASTVLVDGVQVSSVSAASGTYTINTVANHPFVLGDLAECEYHSQTADQHWVSPVTNIGSATQFQVSFGSLTFSAGAATFGWCNILNTFLENGSDHVTLQDFQLTQATGSLGKFSNAITNDNDQQFIIERAANRSSTVIENTANWPMGAFFYQRTDQGNNGIMYIHNTELTNVNCMDGGENGVVFTDSVCQGFPVYGTRYFGGFQPATFQNIYEESTGSTVDPLFGIPAQMGMLFQGGLGSRILGNFPISGWEPTFASGGGTGAQRNYFVVPRSSTQGYGPMWYIGQAQPTSGSVNIPLQWPSIELQDGFAHASLGTLTWDILMTTSTTTTSPAPFGTGSFAIATNVSGSCTTAGMCSFTDTQAGTNSYTVQAQQFTPAFWFWPSNIALNNTTLIWDEGITAPAAVATQGIQSVAITSPQCISLGTGYQRSPIILHCPTITNATHATLFPNLNGTTANSKGRLNLGQFPNAPNAFITLYDSNFGKTTATAGERPSEDPTDTSLDADVTQGLALHAGVSISDYIDVVPTGSNWTRQLTSTSDTINVAVSLPSLPACQQIGIALTSFDVTNTAEYHSSLCPGETVKQLLGNCPTVGTCTAVVDEGNNVNVGAAGTGGGSGDYPVTVGGGYQSTGGAGAQWTNQTLDVRGTATCTQTGLTLPTTTDCLHIGNYGKLQGPNDGNAAVGGGLITTAPNATYRYIVSNAGVCASPCTPGNTGAPGWMNYLQQRFLLNGVSIQTAGSANLQALLNITAVEGRTDVEHFSMLGTTNTPNILVQDGPNSADMNNTLFSDGSSYCGNVSGCVPLQIVSGAGGTGINFKFHEVTLGNSALGVGCNTGAGGLLCIDGSTGGTTNTHALANIMIDGLYLEVSGTYPPWAATHPYLNGNCIKPTTNNTALNYFCATSGTTGASQPNWDSICGTNCTDSGVTWTNKGTVSPSNCVEIKNARDVDIRGFQINAGFCNNGILLDHSGAGKLGRIWVGGFVSSGHTTNIINNLASGDFISGSTPTDVPYLYPGDVGTFYVDGNTTVAGTLQAKILESGGIGANAGYNALVGNTVNPAIIANSAGWLGPPTTPFTGYACQLPSTPPSGGQVLSCGTPSSGVSTGTWVNPGGAAPAPPPGWLAYFGVGTSGALNVTTATNLSGLKYYTTFACSAAVTSNVNNTALVIRATTSITLSTGCTFTATGLSTTFGDSGGSGGGGGGGVAAGTAGNTIKAINGGSYQALVNGGAAGAASGGTGGNGNALSAIQQDSLIDTGIVTVETDILGGAAGGAGGSTGGAGGNGGGVIILIAPTITIASGVSFTANGATGTAGGSSTGGGGGGGGGVVIIRSPALTDSGATFSVTGGAGGAAGTGTSGGGGNGANGWTIEIPL